MGNSFSNDNFDAAIISEAMIDGQVEELMKIIQDENRIKILNKVIYKKDQNGRNLLHNVRNLSLWFSQPDDF